MTRITQSFVVDANALAELTKPRTDIVAELSVEHPDAETAGIQHWLFKCAEGPFESYERRVSAEAIDDQGFKVDESTQYRLDIPVWRPLLNLPIRRALKNRRSEFNYWWAPPDRLNQRASRLLSLLCVIQVIDGYLGTVLTQTLTFAADEFNRGNTAQSVVFSVVRIGVMISLAVSILADRRGRRDLVIGTALGSCLFTVAGAFAPDLWWIAVTQVVARGLSTALGILIVIMAAEEMPARSRAWAASVLVLSAGLGSGMAVWVLPLGWRAVYLTPILGVAVIMWVARHLTETQRFTVSSAVKAAATFTTATANSVTDSLAEAALAARRRQRLALLGATTFLIALFAAPASGFQNDFLKDERGFSEAGVSLFTLCTSTPAGLGVLAGGMLAETLGRRRVGAAGLTGGVVLSTASFFTAGPTLWILSVGATLAAGFAVPALAVFGPELFGTRDRGRENGIIVTLGVLGSVVGLATTGWASDRLDGRIGPILAILAVGPLVAAMLVLFRYPETANLTLEELNPEDRQTSPSEDYGRQ